MGRSLPFPTIWGGAKKELKSIKRTNWDKCGTGCLKKIEQQCNITDFGGDCVEGSFRAISKR